MYQQKKTPDMMKVPQANKTKFDDRIYMINETKLYIKQNTQIASNIRGGEIITQNIDRNESLSHLYLSLEPKTINSVLSEFSFSLFSDIQTCIYIYISLKQDFRQSRLKIIFRG